MTGAMANLRDQLLRAGLVDQKAKQQADTAARRNRKSKKKKKGQPSQEELRRQAFEDRLASEAEGNRLREAEQQRAREAKEVRNRVANLAGAWAVREPRPGPRRFCFVTREQRINWLDVSPDLGWKLELGQVAIVERPGDVDEPHAVVPARIAGRIERLEPECVRFWNRSPTAHGLPEYSAASRA